MALKKWVKLSSERVFESQFLSVNKNVWQLPNGEINDNYYSFVRPDYVILATTKKPALICKEKLSTVSVRIRTGGKLIPRLPRLVRELPQLAFS